MFPVLACIICGLLVFLLFGSKPKNTIQRAVMEVKQLHSNESKPTIKRQLVSPGIPPKIYGLYYAKPNHKKR